MSLLFKSRSQCLRGASIGAFSTSYAFAAVLLGEHRYIEGADIFTLFTIDACDGIEGDAI